MSLPKPWSLSVRRLVTSWPWPILAPPAFAGQSAEAASKGQTGAAPKNAGCRARPGLGAQGHPRASPLTPPPTAGVGGPARLGRRSFPLPRTGPRSRLHVHQPHGHGGRRDSGAARARDSPGPPLGGGAKASRVACHCPVLSGAPRRRPSSRQAAPSGTTRLPSPVRARAAACFSRLPSGGQPGSMAAEGWAGGRCYSQQVPGCLLPGTNLRTAPGTRGPLQVRTWLRHAACLPPPPEESRPEGTRPVLSTDTQSVLSLHDFRHACAQSISWAGDGDERPVERHVQGAAGAPALLAMNPPPTPPLTATGNRK